MITFPWNQELPLLDGHFSTFCLGSLVLVIAKAGPEWRICALRKDQELAQNLPHSGLRINLPKNLTWVPFNATPEDSKFYFMPALPNMPVVSRPKFPISLSPDVRARFFIEIPLLVEIFVQSNGKFLPVYSVASEIMSYTWRGNIRTNGSISSTEGELCYSLSTPPHLSFKGKKFAEYSIICPIEITSRATPTVSFDRISLNVNHFAIYRDETNFWTNTGRILVSRDKEVDGLLYLSNLPKEVQNAKKIVEPRSGALRRSLYEGALHLISNQPQIIK